MRASLIHLALAVCTLSTSSAIANNLQISNVSQSGSNISFTISWENSWNTTNNINPLYPNNWDAAWVFIKYQNQIDNLWKHVKLSSTVADHSVTGGGAPLVIETTTDSMGVFIRRSTAGAGNIVNASVTLRMGSLIGSGDFNFKVFGIEMVYANQDTVQMGDGNISGAFYLNPITITAAKQASGLTGGELYSGSPAIPAAFPMGFGAIYAMKYEATMEQWVDFLNTLTYDQQNTRIDIAPNAAANTRAYTVNPSLAANNTIEVVVPGLNNTQPAVFGCDYTQDNVYNTSNDGQNIPFVSGSKSDILAYLDWSGLRPLSEMEFEKLCRGPRPRVSTEFAWGSTALATRTRVNLINSGTANEVSNATVVNGQAMANSGNQGHGPARNGVFATNSSGRASSGAGFYGHMELSGNCWEVVVAAGTGGTGFTRSEHGDGLLTTLGDANQAGWPEGYSGLNTGITIRGGSWWETSSHIAFLTASYRNPSGLAAARSLNLGIRGCRSAN